MPYTPGGGTDTVTRHIAERITQETKWAFLVDNKPGGGGNIGLDFVAKSRPDGYTIGMGQTANIAINPAALPKMPFDPSKDIVPVALVAQLPMVMVVRADSPWQGLADMVKAAKARPGEVKQALAGTGTVGHVAGEMLARKVGFKVLNVAVQGRGTGDYGPAGRADRLHVRHTPGRAGHGAGRQAAGAGGDLGQAGRCPAERAHRGRAGLPGIRSGGLESDRGAGRHAARHGQAPERGRRQRR